MSLPFNIEIFIIATQGALDRLDWFGLGAGSISKTGAFIAMLMAASWGLVALRKRFVFWIVFLANCILGYFLILTYSRGAFVAVAIAFLSFLILSPIRISTTKSMVIAIAAICGVLFSNAAGFTDRMGKMIRLESSSANVRYDLYSAGLKMLTDAPDGFREPDSPAKAYMRWYQRMYGNEEYNTLVNSHLEFLNRHGIIYKLLYILFWSFVFSITFSCKKSILSSAAFSIWIAFFLNSIFSNIATFWLLWILPALYLIIAIYINRTRFRSITYYLSLASIFVVSALLLFLSSCLLCRDVKICFKNDAVKVGKHSNSEIFIYSQNDSVLGRKYGLELIDWIKGKNIAATVGIKPDSSTVYKVMVVTGEFNIENILKSNSQNYVFLNPTFENAKDLLPFFQEKKATVIIGEITDFRNLQLWKEFFSKYKNANTKLRLLDSVGTYMSNWTSYIEDGIYE